MRYKILTFLFMYFLALNISAQEDTIRIVCDSLEMKIKGKALKEPLQIQTKEWVDVPFSSLSKDSFIKVPIHQPFLMVPYYTNPSPMFKGDYSTGRLMLVHRYGMLMGAGGQTTIPGIGRSNYASMSYIHSFSSQWLFSIGIDANKMHMNHFTGQTFGASGTFSYRATDRLTFIVFGGYNSGFVSGRQSFHYGGTVGFDMTERFGMEMGVQRYYNPLRGGWETVPIATPYYRFNNGTKMGFDVGGLLYQIFRGASLKGSVKRGTRPNPTIVPQGPRIEIR